MVENPQDIERFSSTYQKQTTPMVKAASNAVHLPSLEKILSEQIPDYIIITNKELRPEFSRLANWKIQKGVPTIIKDIDEIREEYIGNDLPEKIHAYLQECRDKWGEGLFVLLGGDTEIVPTRTYFWKGAPYPSDAYYSDLDADWNSNKNNLYAENENDGVKLEYHCHIGRAPVNNQTETQVFVNKVLAYEKLDTTTVNTNYFMNHLAVVGYNKKEANGYLSGGGKSEMDGYLSRYPQLKKYYLFDHFNCHCNNHAPTPDYENGNELNKSNLITALNDGDPAVGKFHIVYHQDHSLPRTMGASVEDKKEHLTLQDIDNLKNGKYQQIVVSGGCLIAQFDKDCIAEHFITNPNGGAVAFIGNAHEGYTQEEVQYDTLLISLYDNKLNIIGPVMEAMSIHSPGYNFYYDMGILPCFFRYHLLGDPEMPVWSAVPQELDVDATYKLNGRTGYTISVKINNLPEGEEATLCMMKDEECYERFTITDTDTHNFAFQPKHDTDMKVTVTARNFIPYETSLPIHGTMAKHLRISSLGDFDKAVTIGDSAEIDITIAHSTSGPVATTATLTSSSPYVTVDNPTMDYGGINKEATRTFKIRVSKDAPETMRNEWNAACLKLTMQGYKDPTWSTTDVDTFRIDLVSPRLRITGIKIRTTGDGDKMPEAGESVVLDFSAVQLGKAATSHLRSWKVVPQEGCEAGVLLNAVNSCMLMVGNSYTAGDPLELKVTLSDGDIPQDSVTVDIAHPLPAIDAMKVNYSAADKAIEFNWGAMANSGSYNIYRSDSENGTYTKLNKLPLETRYFLDDSLDEHTTYYYKLSALTEGKMEGSLSEAFKVTTPYPLMLRLDGYDNFLYWNGAYTADFDYDGKEEIVQVGWRYFVNNTSSLLSVTRHDGTEPYDIDSNPISLNGYAEFPYQISGVPTVADIYGNGEPCIVTVPNGASSEDGKLYAECYSSLDEDGDGRPDLVWRKEGDCTAYRGAAVTNIDAPDASNHKEVVYIDLNGYVHILNADGTQRARFGNSALSGNYGGVAVADLDGDGKKEIVCGGNGGVYVWKNDGTAFGNQPLLAVEGSNLKSAPVVCDLDGDGTKEIVIAERNAADNDRVFAIKPNGTCLPGFDGSQASASIDYPSGGSQGINHAVSVADIDGDGSLEVVSLGQHCVKAWSNDGTVALDCEIDGVFGYEVGQNHFSLPIIADIDGDGEMDLAFCDRNVIYAINADGTAIDGFPITIGDQVMAALCVSDIASDGRNGMVVSGLGGYINVWKTDGHGVAWGRARFDAGNTGEYVEGGSDPIVVTADRTWGNEPVNNDIIVRSGTLTFPHGEYQIRPGCKIIVMDGGTLNVYGGVLLDANILVKSGGSMVIDNNGVIYLEDHGDVKLESGASFDFITGDIFPLDWWE